MILERITHSVNEQMYVFAVFAASVLSLKLQVNK
jgi:hypothetical protein